MAAIPSVTLSVRQTDGTMGDERRIIPEVLVSPVLGNYLPANLTQFATLLDPVIKPDYSVDVLKFGGSGAASYQSDCDVELLRARR